MVVKMASDEVARLRLELEVVDRERDSILSRLARLEIYLAVHAEFSGLSAPQTLDLASVQQRDVAQPSARIVSAPRAPGSGERIMRAVVEVLKEAGRPVMTRDLLAPLSALGIQLGGGDDTRATSHLSSVLSKHRAVLRGSRRVGWSLVEWGGEEDEHGAGLGDDVPTDATDAAA